MALTLRTDDELDDALTALASAENRSRQEIIRDAVMERYERRIHTDQVKISSAEMVDRWRDVLDRLRSV